MTRLIQTLIVAAIFSLPLAALNYPVHGFSIFLSLVLWRHYFPLPPETETAEQKVKNRDLPSREQFLANLDKDSTTRKEASNHIEAITETAMITEPDERQGNECLICWSSPSITLHCNHSFCLSCLTSHFTTHASKNSCPVCSTPLFRPTFLTSENINIWCHKTRIVLSILILLLYILHSISCFIILRPSITSIRPWARCTIGAGGGGGWIGVMVREVPYLVLSAVQIWWYRWAVREVGVDWTQGGLQWTSIVPAVGWVQKAAGMVMRVEIMVRMAGLVG